MIAKFRYHRENSVIAKIENFAMHSIIRYDSENSNVAKFWHYSSPFHCLCDYYSHCSIPFLLALIFFIPGLLKLIENHMKLMEINPPLL